MQSVVSFKASILIGKRTCILEVKKEQNLKEYVHHISEQYKLPEYMATCLYSVLLSAMSQISQKETLHRLNNSISSKEERKKAFLDTYQTHTLEYNQKQEEDIFPRAYHTLIHCPIPNIFDILLDLEQSYTCAIQEIYTERDQALEAIEVRQANELENTLHMTTVFPRHVEEMELFRATWQSNILQTQQTQRQEYRAFVVELYREYQSRTALCSEEKQNQQTTERKLDGKEMVEVAASRVQCGEPTEAHTSDKGSFKSNSSSKRRSSLLSQSTEYFECVKSIQEMGFAKEQAEAALTLSNQSLEAAIGLLLENPSKVDAHLQQPVHPFRRSFTQAPRSRSNSNLTENKRHSLQRYSTTPALLQTGTKNPHKSWNPISFLHQQKSVMENTNLSSVRKLGGWLGKAMENLGMDEEKQRMGKSLHAPPLVESFTISMGTSQVKSTHNLRLLVTDSVVPFDPLREMAYRAETSTKLYTSHLSASIMLVELAELHRHESPEYGWRNYKSGKGSNQSLFERCQQSTEFHFADIESQISLAQLDFEARPQGLEEGSFFVTKHSNLPNVQVVFHLLVDGSGRSFFFL
ncbi:hypothetical protein BY458DRAFT_523892 [Sporodiniella umbellata]|nr:hypothetical protein BY458DRAFT_523892 [Sporodiniella umbellata]